MMRTLLCGVHVVLAKGQVRTLHKSELFRGLFFGVGGV